jgi:hypothetical protein
MPVSFQPTLAKAVLAFVAWVSPSVAQATAHTFENAPISCGLRSQYKGCTATFDGRTLSVNYAHPEGKHTLAVYRGCVAGPDLIQCDVGEWRSAVGAGPLGSRSIGLRNGLPFSE